MTKDTEFVTTEQIVREIQAVLKPYDGILGLAALNFCMAAHIAVRFDGAEGALKHSDEQTRFLTAELTRGSSKSHRTH